MKKSILNYNYSLRYTPRSLNPKNFKKVQNKIKNGLQTKYYYNNAGVVEWKELIGVNKKIFYQYKNNDVVKKVTEIYIENTVEVREVTYNEVKVSNLYVYKDEILKKKVTVFFRDGKKFRAASYHFANGIMNEWQRYVYDRDEVLKHNVKTYYVNNAIEVKIRRYSSPGVEYSTGTFKFINRGLESYNERMHFKNIYEVDVKKTGLYYLVETRELSKYAFIIKAFEIPIEIIENEIKYEFIDFSETINYFLNEDNIHDYITSFKVV